MLSLNREIGFALYSLVARDAAASPRTREPTLVRVDMNTYVIEERGANEENTSNRALSGAHDGTSAIMRVISVVMQDIQQRNLNAKHLSGADERASAPPNGVEHDAASSRRASLEHGTLPANVYVGLHRGCSQRKMLELCCFVDNTADAVTLSRSATACRLVFAHPKAGVVIYLLTSRGTLAETLRRVRRLPRLVFTSWKNALFERGLAAYVGNYMLYHTFHECARTFNERLFGARHRHMRALLFFLAIANYDMLRRSGKRNANLAMNAQSIGKAHNDAGMHVFSENSIHHVKRVKDTSSYSTQGLLVNRSLGRVSRVGINAFTASLRLRQR